MAKKLTSEDADRLNDPEAIFRKHFDLILPLKTAMEKAKELHQSAQGEYRAAIKAAKSDGIEQDALLEFLRIRKEEPEDVTRRFAALNKMILWAGLPIGTQLGLEIDGRSIATRLEDGQLGKDSGPERLTDRSLTAVAADGHEAFSNDLGVGANPYPTDSIPGQRWLSGFRLAEEQALGKAKTEGDAGQPESDAHRLERERKERVSAKAAAKAAEKPKRPRSIKPPATRPEHPDQPTAA